MTRAQILAAIKSLESKLKETRSMIALVSLTDRIDELKAMLEVTPE